MNYLIKFTNAQQKSMASYWILPDWHDAKPGFACTNSDGFGKLRRGQKQDDTSARH